LLKTSGSGIHIVEYKQWIYRALYYYDVYIWDDIEVIGNIYENLDLIAKPTREY
jgi:predicted membrane protein